MCRNLTVAFRLLHPHASCLLPSLRVSTFGFFSWTVDAAKLTIVRSKTAYCSRIQGVESGNFDVKSCLARSILIQSTRLVFLAGERPPGRIQQPVSGSAEEPYRPQARLGELPR